MTSRLSKAIARLARLPRAAREGQLLTTLREDVAWAARGIRKQLVISNLLYFLDEERRLNRRFEERLTPVGPQHVRLGNYYLDGRIPLDESSVVYSFGVGMNIDFDLAIARRAGCTVHLFDPTPESAVFMERYADQRHLRFMPVGVWTETATVPFYEPPLGGSASMVMHASGPPKFEGRVEPLRVLMTELGHEHIDVLKMDIEGAALDVLEQMVTEGILPTQIVVELERPRGDRRAILEFFDRVRTLCTELERRGYETRRLPRAKARYFGLELLFARREA
jgi:FkbM family methyltransferase